MRKSSLSIVLIVAILIIQNNFATCATGNFIPIITLTPGMIPPTPPTPSPSPSPNNGGAAFAVGTGAGVVAAAGTAALSPFLLPGLLIGAAANMDCPLLPICLSDGKVIAELIACSGKFDYILKAISRNCIHDCCVSKYVLITDSYINAGTYNIVSIKLPKELLKANKVLSVKITQISNPYSVFKNKAEIESKLYINKSPQDIFKLYKHQKSWKSDRNNSEVFSKTLNMDRNLGILEKYGEINFTNPTNDIAILVTSYDDKGRKPILSKGAKGPQQKYAILVEFSN